MLLFASPMIAQGTGTGVSQKQPRKRNVASQDVSAQLSRMQNSIDAQQQQIQKLMQQLQSRDNQIQQLQQQMNQVQSTATQAQQRAETAASQSAQQQQDVASLRSDVSDVKMSTTNTALALQETQKNVSDAQNPLTLHFKGIDITPGGFVAAETVWRQHALASDINTPFNSVPYGGASQNSLSEFFGSGRQSRLSLLAEGKLNSAKLTGYYEADFLSAGITSNNNQSNSYSLRQRQVWAQAALKTGWSFTGGQMWSLVTETKQGLDNRTEAPPIVIDAQYNVGFSWARQYGFRVTKDFGNKVWLGFSVEDSQSTLGGHGASNNSLVGSQGTGGGLYNATANYSFNATPDFVFKAAFQPGFGHYEVFGVVSDFRDRIFPCFAATSSTPCVNGSSNPATGAYNNSGIGAGIGANARVSTLNKHLDLGLHFLGGNGIGRYGTVGLPDLTVRPDGVLVPLRNYQSLATVETHGKRLDVYFNFGGEYSSRAAFINNGTPVGYGSTLYDDSGCSKETAPGATSVIVTTPTGTATIPVPGSVGTPLTGGFNPGGLSKCSGDTKSILEATVGFWYRFYKGPKGTLQFGPQYSWVGRYGWSDKNGLNPEATENMVLTSFRYYLP
jgi:archaellum component FlaC